MPETRVSVPNARGGAKKKMKPCSRWCNRSGLPRSLPVRADITGRQECKGYKIKLKIMFKVPNEYRIREGELGSADDMGNNGAFLIFQ